MDDDKTVELADGDQLELVTQALLFVFQSACEAPYPIPPTEARKMARQAIAVGLLKTVEATTEVTLPNWVIEGVRQQAAEVLPEMDAHAVAADDAVVEAPEPPKKIPRKLLGVIAD